MSVIIIGGGMTGATLALALSVLSNHQINIDLVEAYELDKHQQKGFDSRTIALAAGSCQSLEKIGLWQELAPFATAINEIQVSDQGHLGAVKIDSQSYGLATLGQVIELRNVGNTLFKQLKQHNNIRLHSPQTVEHIHQSQQQITVLTRDGKEITGKLVVVADGGHSSISDLVNLSYREFDYQQIAVIANIGIGKAHNGRAFERFTPYGPIALLPMSEQRSALVWCIAQNQLSQVQQWSDAEFLQHLQLQFGWRLGQLLRVGKRDYYPLLLRQAEHCISHRIVFVGNAAQTLHPVAGQGFNLALRDVMTLAEILSQAEQDKLDLGSFRLLNSYQQKRQSDRQQTINVTQGLLSLFSNQFLPAEIARNLGLIAMNNCRLLRDQLVNKTLGFLKY